MERVPAKVWPVLILCLWAGVILALKLLRLDAFGIDEGAAQALLLNWAISDQVVNPVATHGSPDFRALLFVPLGLYWAGSVTAAKVYTLLLAFTTALILFHWNRQQEGHESALVATGLFLISPLLLLQVDAMGTGLFVLLIFALGMYLDKKYRASDHVISSLYFVQLLLVASAITLHPIGLAYPMALAWHWHRHPKNIEQSKRVWIGLAITTLIMVATQFGWVAIAWGQNPLNFLNDMISGVNILEPDMGRWAGGIIPALLLAYLIIKDWKFLSSDLLGSMLLLSTLIGLSCADQGWAFIAGTLILYRGVPELIRLNKAFNAAGFMGQRGVVMVAIMVLATLFMLSYKAHALQIRTGALAPQDQLIQGLQASAADREKPFVAASQWPARTMLICKRDVFPLPPYSEDAEVLYNNIKKLTHLIFDHRDQQNILLAQQIANLGGRTETMDIQVSGVIIKVRDSEATLPPSALADQAPTPPEAVLPADGADVPAAAPDESAAKQD